MPSAEEFLSAPKTRSADAFLTTPAAPTPAPAPKSADSFLGPPPAPRASPKPLTAAVDYLKAKGGELAGDYAVRNREARAQMKQGAEAFSQRADNPIGKVTGLLDPNAETGGVGGVLDMATGAFNYLASPVNAAIDTVVGRPVSKATGGRLQPRDVGDAALAVEGFLVGPKKTGAPRAVEGTEYGTRSGPGYEAIREGARPQANAVRRPSRIRAAAAAAAAPSAEEFLDDGLDIPPAPRATTAAATEPRPFGDAPVDDGGLDIPPTPRARTRTMAANEPSRDWEIVGPSTERVGGPVVGGEADAVERVDNALYRMGGHDTADKLEIKQFLKGVPKEISDPEVQEELYHAIEAKMADPNAQIPDHLALAEAYMRPYYEEQTAIINRLRERGDPNIEPFLQDQGYVARRAVGHTPMLDEAGGPRSNRDPIMGGKSLFKKTTAQKKRTAGWVLEDENGNRTFAQNPDPAWEHGQVIEGSFGRPMTVKQATTREIEANTDTRYHKNALVNTLDNVARLRRVERNLEVLDEVTTNLKSEGKAWRSQWTYPDPDTGRPTLRRNPTERPEGFVELPHVPQLRDWYFDPKVAEALRDYYPSPNEPLDSVLQKVNRTLTASLFITPIPHALNVAAHWTVGRGWDWMNPGSYRTLAKTGTRAMVDVFTMSRNYQKMLREGSGLMAGDTQVRDFHKLLLEKAGAEFLDDPRAVGAFAKAAGLPVAAIRKVYELSNKALWMSNDIFMLQRQYELEARGMSTRKAIFEAERDIPNYRIPPQVMGSRSVSQWLRDPNIMMFGRYKYGQARAWGVMFKDLVKGTPEQKLDAAGKFLVAALVANVAYPIADAALQHLTGNKDAKLKRSGGFSMTDAAWQVGTGQKDAALGLSSFMSLAPLTSEGIAIAQNHDFFGRPIRQPGSSAPAQALQMGEYAAQNAFYPAGLAMEATKPGPGNAVSALGKLAGLELPAPGKEERKAKYKARDRRSALRHEARDPIEQTIKKGFRKVTGQ